MPQNIAQQVTDAIINYLLKTITLEELLGEMVAAIAELDAVVATHIQEPL